LAGNIQVAGTNKAALFNLRISRGEGMALLAMNWKKGRPGRDFVGFAIEYCRPGEQRFHPLRNRLAFPHADGSVDPNARSTLVAPIQKFRWVHFPFEPSDAGDTTYRVTPVYMDSARNLSYGAPQTAAVALRRETYPGKLNVTFTRGFVSSQAFVDRYVTAADGLGTLLPTEADDPLAFVPTHPRAADAYAWMGFEARAAILRVLDDAVADANANVLVVAYDLNLPEIVSRLEQLGPRLRIIIDSSDEHGQPTSPESAAETRLRATAGAANVRRQKLAGLQHNKTIVVQHKSRPVAVCGSTNFSWRGFYIQNNNAVVLTGKSAVAPFVDAFEDYWTTPTGAANFRTNGPTGWNPLGLAGIDADVTFSPHGDRVTEDRLADDIGNHTSSSLLYSLAFLAQTKGEITDAIKKITHDGTTFVFGMADRKVGGIELQTPDGRSASVSPAALAGHVPPPFKTEPSGVGGTTHGTRLHHKSTARVYFGSYNFSNPAQTDNGENLLLVRNRRIATAYMIEGIRIFDHYEFRVRQRQAATAKKTLTLALPPKAATDKPWWDEDWTDSRKRLDRELFA
jgi:phosphatidylserine/phosphatidylglycerophosphate/cardiolipin synthase-like enzyme